MEEIIVQNVCCPLWSRVRLSYLACLIPRPDSVFSWPPSSSLSRPYRNSRPGGSEFVRGIQSHDLEFLEGERSHVDPIQASFPCPRQFCAARSIAAHRRPNMAPPRSGARRRSAAASADSPLSSRRLSVRRREPFKREARDGSTAGAGGDDDGLPLSDEALLLVFSALSATSADLVRCAATCRRWRRLVSPDAAFICRRAQPPRSDPFIRSLALGFFHSRRTDGGAAPEPPRFVPLSAAASRYQPALAALVDGASRVLASRGGRLVLDLRRRANSRTTHTVRLGVCDQVVTAAGAGVDVLPPLRGKDSPSGPFACTVITAADEHGTVTAAQSQPQHASSYRVLLLYNRLSFTALRCYSSDAGSWGPEAQVVGARIGRSQLRGEAHAAVVHHGVVLWPRLAVALRLDSVIEPAPAAPPAAKKGSAGKTPPPPPRYTVAGFSLAARQRRWSMSTRTNAVHRLLGVMPDGELLRVEADQETIRAYWGGRKGGDGDGHGGTDGGCLLGEALKWKWTMHQALMGVHAVRLLWLFEKSGLFIFTATNNTSDHDTHVYTMDVETKQFRTVATGGGEPLLMEMCGYEMDRVALLASLGQ
ncbi:hypothetical protein BS78_07G051900 [Paspalum vaginatum]|nr:hypothetical protein BS78_07G051900 [Paspalum vaginatum]